MAQQVRPAFWDPSRRSGPSRGRHPIRNQNAQNPIIASHTTCSIKRPDIYMQSFLTQLSAFLSLANRGGVHIYAGSVS